MAEPPLSGDQFCGFVAIVGQPNVGKSTLLNRLVESKLAITSPKPQSTRRRVVGLVTDSNRQAVLIDTPGILEPEYDLHIALGAETASALSDADLVIHVSSALDPEAFPSGCRGNARQVVLEAQTKSDLLASSDSSAAIVPPPYRVSAVTGAGIPELRQAILANLPRSPFLYPADDLSSQESRFFAAEFVREAAFELLKEELPYSLHVAVEEYRETAKRHYIRTVAYVERESQKTILLGKGGAMIREIGRAARLKIEGLVGTSVYLDIWVKVASNWRRDPDALRRFGFRLPEPFPRNR